MNNEKLLGRIASYLILHTSHQRNLGLLTGKMGIVIFFFHYSSYIKKKIYSSFAFEILDEIYKEISIDSSCSFDNGLAGIAWGIEYLVQKKFVKGNTNDILEELDNKIMKLDVRKMKDSSLSTGLEGIVHYAISRCSQKSNDILIPSSYIQELNVAYQHFGSNNSKKDVLLNKLRDISKGNEIDLDTSFLEEIIIQTKIPRNIFIERRPLGIINNGYAGIGLKIVQNDKTKSIYI